jgi:hypothetical protein
MAPYSQFSILNALPQRNAQVINSFAVLLIPLTEEIAFCGFLLPALVTADDSCHSYHSSTSSVVVRLHRVFASVRTTSFNLQHSLQFLQRNSLRFGEEEEDHDKLQKHHRGEEGKRVCA